MAQQLPVRLNHLGRATAMAATVAALLGAAPATARAPGDPKVSIVPPFPVADFHFSDPGRDARYWQLYADMERSAEAFRQALYAARVALRMPISPIGSPRWLEVRAAVQRAIEARRPARDALNAMIRFATREGPQLPPAEAEFALDLRHDMEDSVRNSSDLLVDLLASLAGIPPGQWPP